MASPAEIENDLRLTGAGLRKTHHDAVGLKMIRGANCIQQLRRDLEEVSETLKALRKDHQDLTSKCRQLEEAAENEAQKYERYVFGDSIL